MVKQILGIFFVAIGTFCTVGTIHGCIENATEVNTDNPKLTIEHMMGSAWYTYRPKEYATGNSSISFWDDGKYITLYGTIRITESR